MGLCVQSATAYTTRHTKIAQWNEHGQTINTFLQYLGQLRQSINPQIQAINKIIVYEKRLKQLAAALSQGATIPPQHVDKLENVALALQEMNSFIQPMLADEVTDAQNIEQINQRMQEIMPILNQAWPSVAKGQAAGQVAPATQAAPAAGTDFASMQPAGIQQMIDGLTQSIQMAQQTNPQDPRIPQFQAELQRAQQVLQEKSTDPAIMNPDDVPGTPPTPGQGGVGNWLGKQVGNLTRNFGQGYRGSASDKGPVLTAMSGSSYKYRSAAS